MRHQYNRQKLCYFQKQIYGFTLVVRKFCMTMYMYQTPDEPTVQTTTVRPVIFCWVFLVSHIPYQLRDLSVRATKLYQI